MVGITKKTAEVEDIEPPVAVSHVKTRQNASFYVVPREGIEPSCLAATDFKSAAYTIPPPGHGPRSIIAGHSFPERRVFRRAEESLAVVPVGAPGTVRKDRSGEVRSKAAPHPRQTPKTAP